MKELFCYNCGEPLGEVFRIKPLAISGVANAYCLKVACRPSDGITFQVQRIVVRPQLPRGLRAFTWYGIVPKTGTNAEFEVLVGVKSKAEAARLGAVSRRFLDTYALETANDTSIQAVIENPGKLLYRKINDLEGKWKVSK